LCHAYCHLLPNCHFQGGERASWLPLGGPKKAMRVTFLDRGLRTVSVEVAGLYR